MMAHEPCHALYARLTQPQVDDLRAFLGDFASGVTYAEM